MFGISSLGWIHTLGSLPAIPVAVYMFARHGRIVPRSTAGIVYFIAMLIGSLTVFIVAHQKVSYVIGIVALVLLLAGYGMVYLRLPGRIGVYLETFCLTLTAFVLMVPTLTETLKRVPEGHPLVSDLHSPLLLGVQGGLFVALVLGLIAQTLHMRRKPQAFRSA
jgi:hypothetical protein